MDSTYALSIGLSSHDYDGEFYIVGDGYGTASKVLRNVAGEHLQRINQASHIADYLLSVLREGENMSQTKYEHADADVVCGIHVDVAYQQYAFWVGDHVYEIDGEPTQSEIESLADELSS